MGTVDLMASFLTWVVRRKGGGGMVVALVFVLDYCWKDCRCFSAACDRRYFQKILSRALGCLRGNLSICLCRKFCP